MGPAAPFQLMTIARLAVAEVAPVIVGRVQSKSVIAELWPDMA